MKIDTEQPQTTDTTQLNDTYYKQQSGYKLTSDEAAEMVNVMVNNGPIDRYFTPKVSKFTLKSLTFFIKLNCFMIIKLIIDSKVYNYQIFNMFEITQSFTQKTLVQWNVGTTKNFELQIQYKTKKSVEYCDKVENKFSNTI